MGKAGGSAEGKFAKSEGISALNTKYGRSMMLDFRNKQTLITADLVMNEKPKRKFQGISIWVKAAMFALYEYKFDAVLIQTFLAYLEASIQYELSVALKRMLAWFAVSTAKSATIAATTIMTGGLSAVVTGPLGFAQHLAHYRDTI